MKAIRRVIRQTFRLAANPHIELLVGTMVVASGLWQLVYELPEEVATGELEGHHAVAIFGLFLVINSLLRFFKGFDQTVMALERLPAGRAVKLIAPVKRLMDHWSVELVIGAVLVFGGFAELYEEYLGIDRLGTAADNDLLWFATLFVIGLSMILKSLSGAIHVVTFADNVARKHKKSARMTARIDAFFRKPYAEGFLAAALLLSGLWHEWMDSTNLGVAGLEAHHGLMLFGAHRLLKFSQTVLISMEFAEDAVEEGH